MGKKVFISHATADCELVNILIQFLNNVGISNDDIFCTSISNTLEGGLSFVEQIKNSVQDSKIVIFLLTERFFLSCFCLAELGAAWALNQNILPIIVPPISTKEYNDTPLIGVQALNIGNENFAKDFYNNLVKKEVVEAGSVVNEDKLFSDFGSQISNEIKMLRKDEKGFYVARLIDNHVRKTQQVVPMVQPQIDQFLFGNRNVTLTENETLWRLNGLLDIETSSEITEHWIAIKTISLEKSARLQFTLGDQLGQEDNRRLFSIKQFYELP